MGKENAGQKHTVALGLVYAQLRLRSPVGSLGRSHWLQAGVSIQTPKCKRKWSDVTQSQARRKQCHWVPESCPGSSCVKPLEEWSGQALH